MEQNPQPNQSVPHSERPEVVLGLTSLFVVGLPVSLFFFATGFCKGYFADNGSLPLGIEYGWKTALVVFIATLIAISMSMGMYRLGLSSRTMLWLLMPLFFGGIFAGEAWSLQTGDSVGTAFLKGLGNGGMGAAVITFLDYKGWLPKATKRVHPIEMTEDRQ